jgi:hypothetical protein
MASSSEQRWVENELRTLSFGDERLNKRARMLVKCFARRLGAAITHVCDNHAEVQAAYRLLSNDAVEPDEIRAALRVATVERLADECVVLVAQDTTCLDYSDHPAIDGLGPTGDDLGHGMFLHSAIAISEDGVPMGLLHQQDWTRDPTQAGKASRRKQLPLEEKESYRWLQTAQAVADAFPDDVQAIIIGDRESDIFELLAARRRAGASVLIRAYRERRLQGEGALLWPTVQQQPVAAQFQMLVHEDGRRHARMAQLHLRYCPLTIRPPKNGVHDPSLTPVTVTAIEVREVNVPKGRAAILWRLLTDLAVTSADDARRCVCYYEKRWLIERYHFVLKSGCRIEQSQLRTVAGLRRLIALQSVVALRLLWLTYSARTNGDAPCTIAFSDDEWRLLYIERTGKEPPEEPPPLREVVLWLAKLGGFLGRKGDGDPGVKVLWRGLTRLQDIVLGFRLATQVVCNA